jgi:hypothetical protein
MKWCWDSNPDNRPSANEIEELIELFMVNNSDAFALGKLSTQYDEDKVIKKQFEEAGKYRKANLVPIKNSQSTTHTQACYTSFTKELSKCDDTYSTSLEVIDFTSKLHLFNFDISK